jgi:glycosyltransferase involved in cell wall biosynthesis
VVIRIHFAYKHIDGPWGGANNFIRGLHAHLAANGQFAITEAIEDECDILFMNQLGMGPARASKTWPFRKIKRLVRGSWWQPRRRPSARKLVVRAVNLNSHAFRRGLRNRVLGRIHDAAVVRLMNMADLVIFQSRYQREFFQTAGYAGAKDLVIHNGADLRFWVERPVHPPIEGALKLVSSTASPRHTKRHDVIARLSTIPGVEVRHMGAWPRNLDPGNVQLLGMLPHKDMLNAFADAHFLLHPAIKDPCPNVVFEAICAGLPIIYSPGPGSSREIVGECGFPLDEANLAGSIDLARSSLADFRANVLRCRGQYRIDHAGARYCTEFTQLLQ